VIIIQKILVNTREKFDEFLKDINDIFAFDTETTSLNIQELNLVGISFHCGTDKSWYIPFGHTQGLQLDMREEVMSQLKDLFCKAKLVIGHNLVFDMQVLRRYNLYPEYTPWFDTMIAYHLIDENDRKGLKYLSKKFLNYTMKTFEETTKGQNISYADMETTKDYACDDAIQTWKLFKLFKKDLIKKDLKSLMKDIEMPFLRCIIEMEWNGILIDREKVDELAIEVKDKLVEVEENIANALPSKFKQKTLGGTYKPSINLDSSKDLVKLLYSELGLEIKYKTDKGVPAVGTPILKKYVNKHPIIPLLIKYKEYQKLQTSFLASLPKHISSDGKVHCRFNDTGTRTGRLCMAKGTLISTTKGKIKIEELCDENNLMKFIDIKNKFIIVYSKEGKRLVDKSIYKGIKKTIIIKTNNNKQLEGTLDHLVYNGENFVALNELKIGDKILTFKSKTKSEYTIITSKEKSKNKVYDIKILTKKELENYYHSIKSRSLVNISKDFNITYRQTHHLFDYYSIKKKPMSLTSNREILSKQKKVIKIIYFINMVNYIIILVKNLTVLNTV